jgi:hypothetical protein
MYRIEPITREIMTMTKTHKHDRTASLKSEAAIATVKRGIWCGNEAEMDGCDNWTCVCNRVVGVETGDESCIDRD